MRRGLIGVVSCALLAALAADASATTVRRLTDEALTAQADAIVIGRTAEREARWVDRDLVTFVTVSVTETLKGEPLSSVTVAIPGGIDANRRFPVAVTYPGAPSLGPDEEVLLFLVNGQDVSGAFAVAGFSQGKFSVVQDAAGVKHVSRDLTTVSVMDANGVAQGTRQLERLSDFREEILGYVNGGSQ